MHIRLTDPKAAKKDCHIIGVFEEDRHLIRGGILSADEKTRVIKALAARKYKGGKSEDVLLPVAVRDADAVYALGLGKAHALTSDTLRRAMSRVVARARSEKWSDVTVDVETFCHQESAAYDVQSLTEGLLLSEYRFDRYKSDKKNENPGLTSAAFAVKNVAFRREAQKAIVDGTVIAEGVIIARELGNEPPNLLYPESYAQRIRKIALEAGLKCQVFEEKKLAALKMGGILGVGQGSSRKPRLVIVEYKSPKARNKKPVVLVGKGITFDTGGISIKPSKSMEEMKFDMCGSAAVVAAVRTAAKLKLPVHVVGITPLAENMPGGNAQRPGDVITCYNGKTVDVLNTDAEGRLVLADALAYAKNYKPLCIVDIATLTGLCASFFDYLASGLMGNDAELQKRLKDAGEKTGERLWELPMWEEFDEMIKGSYGDIQNISRATAGTITAGMFLKHFGGHAPWAHLDVAGTAWGTSARGYNPLGATGVGVRLFVEFLKSYC